MGRDAYRLTESVADFPEGEILDVTARFGDWHIHDLELEPRRRAAKAPRKVTVADSETGFSEAAILDETARFGDWHEYDLDFEPGTDSDQGATLTMAAFEAVTKPLDGHA